jgi:hypothetical protein
VPLDKAVAHGKCVIVAVKFPIFYALRKDQHMFSNLI